MSLIQPPQHLVERGQRFVRRQAAWRQEMVRRYGPHPELTPYAPAVLAAMFDKALADATVPGCYALRASPLGVTVFLNTNSWRWYDRLGTVEGRGLYEMWAWRFDIPVEQAHSEVWSTINATGEAGVHAA